MEKNKSGLKVATTGVGAFAGLLAGLAVLILFGVEITSAVVILALLSAAVGGQVGYCAGFALAGERGETLGQQSAFVNFGASAALYALIGGQPLLWGYTAYYIVGGDASDSAIASHVFRALLFAVGGALGLTIGFMSAFFALLFGVVGFGMALLAIMNFDGAWAIIAGILCMTPFVVSIAIAALLKIPDAALRRWSADASE